jgi:uncharacterized membrane protein
MAAFLHLIDHFGRGLRPVSVISRVGRDGARVIEAMYPELFAESMEERGRPAHDFDGQPLRQVVRSRAGGVVLAFDAAGLVATARASNIVIDLVPQVGDFVAQGDPLFQIRGGLGPLDGELLHQRIALGAERT